MMLEIGKAHGKQVLRGGLDWTSHERASLGC
jgi:hypothetical protein